MLRMGSNMCVNAVITAINQISILLCSMGSSKPDKGHIYLQNTYIKKEENM